MKRTTLITALAFMAFTAFMAWGQLPLDMRSESIENVDDIAAVTVTLGGDQRAAWPDGDVEEAPLDGAAHVRRNAAWVTFLSQLTVTNLTDLADVDAGSPGVNEVLGWSGAAWTPRAAGAGDMLVFDYDPAGGQRQVAFSNDLAAVQSRTNDWDAAYGWGDWSGRVGGIEGRTNDWNTAHGWGDHGAAGYVTAPTVTNVVTAASVTPYAITDDTIALANGAWQSLDSGGASVTNSLSIDPGLAASIDFVRLDVRWDGVSTIIWPTTNLVTYIDDFILSSNVTSVVVFDSAMWQTNWTGHVFPKEAE